MSALEARSPCKGWLHNVQADGQWLQKVTAAWQQGKLSNLDYLLFCNLAAGRSFNDLTQWPVFPWVLADYTSGSIDLSDPSTYRQVYRSKDMLHVCEPRTPCPASLSFDGRAPLPRIMGCAGQSSDI